MNTIDILHGIQKWMQEDFTSTQDFEDAQKGMCDMEVSDGSESYVVNYMLQKNNKLWISAEKAVNVPVNGKKRWFPDQINTVTSNAIESFFIACFYERQAEVEEEEAEMANEYMPDEDDMWEEKEFEG